LATVVKKKWDWLSSKGFEAQHQ